MGTVRSLISRLIAALALAAAVVAATAGTAIAGGPTSVLLASPYADAAAGLYYTDRDYDRLQALLGGPDLPAGAPQPPAAAGAPYVTATWLVHDVYAWRIDRIFLIGDEVWVVSVMSGEGGPLTGKGMYPGETGDAEGVWHRPTDAAALTALLTTHSLTPESATRPSAGAEPPSTAPIAGETAIAPAAASSPAPGPMPWRWGIGGLVAGLLIGGTLVRATMARRAAPRPESRSSADPARMQPID